MKSTQRKIQLLLIITFVFGLNTPTIVAFNSNEVIQVLREIKGQVINVNTKKPLVFVTVNLLESNISTITNSEGNFVLKIPASIENGKIQISHLGFESKEVALSELTENFNTIMLNESVTELQEINLMAIGDAFNLVKEVFKNKEGNYLKDPTVMTAFYRESIQIRNRNVSLSEAVINIYKKPYTSNSRDDIKIFKARKSTDYRRLDTVVFKLQGGPFNSLLLDIVKYPEYIFSEEQIDSYDFNFDRLTEINDQLIYVIKFKQKENIKGALYTGELYIQPQNKILVSAVYSLNITNTKEASKLFVRKKPRNTSVYPQEVVYRVDYKENDGKWQYSYGKVMLKLKIDWDKKLFNSTCTINSELVITDWKKGTDENKPKKKELIKPSIILSEQVIGFSDPDFWGEDNIIEPEKSIESAIKKIKNKFEKSKI